MAVWGRLVRLKPHFCNQTPKQLTGLHPCCVNVQAGRKSIDLHTIGLSKGWMQDSSPTGKCEFDVVSGHSVQIEPRQQIQNVKCHPQVDIGVSTSALEANLIKCVARR
ncbi:hypothetical protein DS901_12885 [Loktanella sp. D2R18]|nr:hypothetical protein DS901_12885 [Loktanella sp. D2R18]